MITNGFIQRRKPAWEVTHQTSNRGQIGRFRRGGIFSTDAIENVFNHFVVAGLHGVAKGFALGRWQHNVDVHGSAVLNGDEEFKETPGPGDVDGCVPAVVTCAQQQEPWSVR